MPLAMPDLLASVEEDGRDVVMLYALDAYGYPSHPALLRYLNHAPMPTPGPPIPSAECHHPCGTNTESPALRSARHAPKSPKARESWALHRSIV